MGEPLPFDGEEFRRVLKQYPTGISVVTSLDDDGLPLWIVVGSFCSVSLDPPLVAFFPAKASQSWARISAARDFCVNVFASDQERLCEKFAKKGAFEKFARRSHRVSANGSPILDGIAAWIDCQFEAVHDAGDHYIVVGRVVALKAHTKKTALKYLKGEYAEIGRWPSKES